MYNKILNSFPVIGSITLSVMPSHETIVNTIVLGIIGAIVGYTTKIALDKIKKYINKLMRHGN